MGREVMFVHGYLVKYKKSDKSTFKIVYITALDGDGTQDAKTALIRIIKKEHHLKDVENVIILICNAVTYSANFFHVACFDVVHPHVINIFEVKYNENQDR